jgi:hypothetical protein
MYWWFPWKEFEELSFRSKIKERILSGILSESLPLPLTEASLALERRSEASVKGSGRGEGKDPKVLRGSEELRIKEKIPIR